MRPAMAARAGPTRRSGPAHHAATEAPWPDRPRGHGAGRSESNVAGGRRGHPASSEGGRWRWVGVLLAAAERRRRARPGQGARAARAEAAARRRGYRARAGARVRRAGGAGAHPAGRVGMPRPGQHRRSNAPPRCWTVLRVAEGVAESCAAFACPASSRANPTAPRPSGTPPSCGSPNPAAAATSCSWPKSRRRRLRPRPTTGGCCAGSAGWRWP